MDWVALGIVAAVLGVAGAFAYRFLSRRRAHEARSVAALSAPGDRIPRSLHPVIDTDVCIGSLSCIKACPEGDILGIVDGAAHLVHGEHCIGHGRCAAECPVSAIKLVFGSEERGVDLPEVDGFFESSRPGVHVVGELGGMGLIKNAIRQGLEAADRIADVLPPGSGEVVIVGGGPAGVATALGLKARGVPHRVLEQWKLGGSILHFPREKVVMTEPVDLPLWGKFGRRTIPKEELLDTLHRIVDGTHVSFQEGVKVVGIEGADGHFVVKTEAGDFPAAKVVLAAGRRGTPRRLGVPGEESPGVFYGLREPDLFAGRRVVVVGGGDAAVESALQLADGHAEVSLSYRGEALARCREENRRAIQDARERGRIELLLPSRVKEIRPRDVLLDVGGREQAIPGAAVVVQIGGELPLELLSRCGVALRRYHGDAPGTSSRAWLERRESSTQRSARWRERGTRAALLLLGAGVLGALWWVGRDYYPLARLARRGSPLDAALKSSGRWGHGVGIAATLFMLSNFLYAARKRWKRLDGLGGIRRWLDVHVFVGTMSPAVIAFHAAFQARNVLAISTAVSLGVVFVTGLVGRFIYSLVPSDGGKAVELEELLARRERLHGDEGAFAIFRLRLQIRFYATLKRLLRGWRTFHATLAVFLVVAMALHIGVSLYLGYGIHR
ncbi:MAG TPA: NAD(P)-binding domain-containing protein [Anaeromyxobacteraceae bacterium]|nr:NAD(P)-binding domain-containing protein [Anaeromyxobacteraceae bacterium]